MHSLPLQKFTVRTSTRNEMVDVTDRLERLLRTTNLLEGMLTVYVPHTTAAVTINENADRDVRTDFETAMNHAAPENLDYVHTLEGPDDMPAHIKSSMLGSSVTIPIRDGAPAFAPDERLGHAQPSLSRNQADLVCV